MTGIDVPVWGQFSILGILLGIVVTGLVMILRGELITGKRQDQIDAQHEAEISAVRVEAAAQIAAAERRSEKWQEAYQASQTVQAQTTATLEKVTSLTEVFELFLNALRRVVPLEAGDDG